MNRRSRSSYRLRVTAQAWAVERLEGRRLLATYPLSAVPALNSDPGAPHTIYLDFVGAPPGTFGNESVPATPAYDVDGDPTTFSDQELANIQEIWARVAEKFSPFNVNVTTVDPGITNHNQVLRQIIGGNGSWTGTNVGGYTGNGTFEGTSSNCSYVFSANFGGDPHNLGEVCAHEEALGLGLYEQESWSGNTLVSAYNYGNSLVAPILGSSYAAQRGIWWLGTTYSPNTIQDDVAVLTSVLGLRPLPAGQTAGSATHLSVSNNNFTASGIIESLGQSDYYSISAPSAGTASFAVNVSPYGPTLHAQLQLLDANGNVLLTANNANTLGQSITANLAAGNYFLVVKSYGQYGDLGQYTLAGSLAASTATFTLSGASSVNEGALYTLNLSGIDPGHTISSWAINWGDGSAVQTVSGNPSTVTHTFASGPHSYTISATATDDVSTYAAGNTQAVSVLHVPPTLGISGPSSVTAGAMYTVNLSSSDAGHTILSWAINWGDGSSIQNVSGNPSNVSHVYASGPASCTISATATDDVGTYSAAATVAVSVQASSGTPVFNISGPASVNEQSPYTLSLSATDPGHTVSSWAINWGDGSAVQTITGNPASVSHVYAAGPNAYSITAAATDDTGTYPAGNSQVVSVLHVPPTVAISGAGSVTLPAAYTLNLSVTDPGHAITGWTINWGDGSPAQVVGNVASVTHAFATPGNYQINASVTDNTATFASNSLSVQVNPVPDTTPPTAIASLGSVASHNTFSVTYSDNVSVKEATLGNGNVLVTGPNGFSELAALSGLSTTSNAPSITAAYILTAPGGAWTYSADGIYTVTMEANSVTDTAGNPVAAETLGTFTINIAPPSIPSKGHHTKSGTLAATGAATYVSFALAAPSMATLQLSTGQPGITLELLDANFNTIAGRSGKKSVSFAQPLNAGTYYVRVSYSGARATTCQVGLTTKPLTVAQRAKLAR